MTQSIALARPVTISRAELYTRLLEQTDRLLEQADRIGRTIADEFPVEGPLGTSGAGSAFPGAMRDDVVEAVSKVARGHVSPKALGDELRKLVKSVYGDDYDVAATASCEAALGVVFDALLTPPQLGRGDPYRSRVIGLLERHAEHQLTYGRPFPPHYKEVFADRGAIAGELGINGRRQQLTDVVVVPMAGSRHVLHGPKLMPAPLLMETDARATVEALTRAAEIHSANLSGFVSLGYDTPGYGYADRNAAGAPVIQAEMGRLARLYNVPYVVDNAWGIPFIGTDPREIGADTILYSMDKVAGAATSGLIIGKEVPMTNVRRALGIQSERFGVPSAHGKGAHVAADPGKLALASLVHVLRTLRDEPERVRDPIDRLLELTQEEFERAAPRLRPGVEIFRSYNLGGVEVNYERTWEKRSAGIPIFTNEDRIAGKQMLGQLLARMGVMAIQSEDGNVLLTPGLGTMNGDGSLNPDAMRRVIRCLFEAMILLGDWAADQHD